MRCCRQSFMNSNRSMQKERTSSFHTRALRHLSTLERCREEAILRRFTRASRGAQMAIATIAAALAAFVSYTQLVQYQPFSGYAPFIAAWILLAMVLAGAYLMIAVLSAPRWLRLGIAAVGIIGGLAAYYVSATRYRGQYPTLHLALSQVGYLLSHAGIAGALCIPLSGSVRIRPLAIAACMLVLPVVAGTTTASLTGANAPASASHRAFTPIGTARTAGPERVSSACISPIGPLTTDHASAVFNKHSGLPQLPSAFQLQDYNVLLISVESMRYDDLATSDERPSLPALRALVQDGAFWFTRAYSPTSRMLLSLASLFDLTYPSHTHVETYVPEWTGRLLEAADTVAEQFADAGYDTFSYTHGLQLDEQVFGFEQGFDEVHREPARGRAIETADAALTKRTVARLRAMAQGARRWFGWVLLVSPTGRASIEEGQPAPYATSTGRSWRTSIDNWSRSSRPCAIRDRSTIPS